MLVRFWREIHVVRLLLLWIMFCCFQEERLEFSQPEAPKRFFPLFYGGRKDSFEYNNLDENTNLKWSLNIYAKGGGN